MRSALFYEVGVSARPGHRGLGKNTGDAQVNLEVSLSAIEAGRVEHLLECGPTRDSPYAGLLKDRTFTRLQFGSEFCESLVPSPHEVRRMSALAESRRLGFSLATPLSSDRTVSLVRRLLALIPSGSEVVTGDWGILRLVHADFPALVPVAGRLLCKEIKDPRLPKAEWSALYPHGIHARAFTTMLKRFGVRRVIMDAALHATADDFRSPEMRVSVHAPWGFAAKGRACRIGSLHLPEKEKFATGHKCRRECLVYAGCMRRDRAHSGELETRQRGNTLFYRHNADMAGTVAAAVTAGSVDRLIVDGDWP